MKARIAALVLLSFLPSAGFALTEQPLRHGVVFLCPEQPQEAIRQLEEIQREGFNLIKFGSWVWTIPTPGSDLEQRAQTVLEWCDQHDMAFFLLHNIQYGNPAEGAGLDGQVLRPEKTLPLLTDWARVLRGHPSVKGVILGNEVAPTLGTPAEAPEFWAQFRQWLMGKHSSLEALNKAWETEYKSLADVGIPPEDSPGWVDCRAYANRRFAEFYGFLFDRAFRPALGEKLYGCKTNLDPFLHRACTRLTMTCWDDLVANFPLWQIKCAADTTGKPVFNSELHLYHNEFMASPRQTRYRYLNSAINGEYMTASFAWQLWTTPRVRDLHAATPAILAEARRLAPYCRALADAYQRAELAVLVTDTSYHAETSIDETERVPPAKLYAIMASLGKPWRYLLEDDVATVRRGTLVVWSDLLKPAVAEALAALPPSVRVITVDAVPYDDEYEQPLPQGLQQRLRRRLEVVPLPLLTETLRSQPALPEAYRKVGGARYWWWSPARGVYQYGVPYAPLELRWTDCARGRLVAVINNYDLVQCAPLPWVTPESRVLDLSAGRVLPAEDTASLRFEPLDVRLFLIENAGAQPGLFMTISDHVQDAQRTPWCGFAASPERVRRCPPLRRRGLAASTAPDMNNSRPIMAPTCRCSGMRHRRIMRRKCYVLPTTRLAVSIMQGNGLRRVSAVGGERYALKMRPAPGTLGAGRALRTSRRRGMPHTVEEPGLLDLVR